MNRFTNRPIEVIRKWTIVIFLKCGKCWNKLFAEAVNTKINCMQVKEVFAGRRRHKKIVCSRSRIYIKKNVWMWIFSKPGHSGNGRTCFGNLSSVYALVFIQSVNAKFVLSNIFVYKAITPLKNSQNLTILYCIVTRNSDKGLKCVTRIQCS